MKLEKLAEEMGLDQEDYVELVELFVQTGLSDLSALQTAIQTGDLEKAAAAAHSLKGAADNFGEAGIFDLARSLQKQIQNGRTDGVEVFIVGLKEKLDRVAARIELG